MKEILVKGENLPEAYHNALRALYEEGEIADCGDWKQRQKELSMTMYVEKPLSEPMISRLFIGGPKDLEQYVQEMLDGILDFEVERGNWNYTYHGRMGDQVDFVINELKRNAETRRAVIDVRTPEDAGSSDPACLQHLQFFIRNGKLDCCILFRSNDACEATFMNAFALIMLQKRIADALGVGMGSYTHRANSFHAYEKDWELLEGYVTRLKEGKPSTFDYEGDWDELMEEARPEISDMVDALRYPASDR